MRRARGRRRDPRRPCRRRRRLRPLLHRRAARRNPPPPLRRRARPPARSPSTPTPPATPSAGSPPRGGALFAHLYRPLRRADVLWTRPIADGPDGPLAPDGPRMTLGERLGLPLLRPLDPERAHGLALAALRAGLGPDRPPVTSPRLATTLAGLALPNPLGLAAGMDKNATAVAALGRAGFGFVEVGAATPRRRPATPARASSACRGTRRHQPLRLQQRRHDGDRRPPRRPPEGLRSSASTSAPTRTSPDRAADFAEVLAHAGPFLDFATVNVSSPNTERLRDLQGKAALAALLSGVAAANRALARPVPALPEDRPRPRRPRARGPRRDRPRRRHRRHRRDQHHPRPRRPARPPSRARPAVSPAARFRRSTIVLARSTP